MVESGKSIREVARHLGYTHSAVVNWVKKAKGLHHNIQNLPTYSPKPHHHPHELKKETVLKILEYRAKRSQFAFIIHNQLKNDGYIFSLSSVKRILKRHGISKYSKWKKWHSYEERPAPTKPGSLVEIDTIHERGLILVGGLFAYSLLDVCSRYGFAEVRKKANTYQSIAAVTHAKEFLPFSIETLQSDNDSEFSKFFTKRVSVLGFTHRHSRVRKPNDNAHLERFNRTLRDERLARLPKNFRVYQKEIPEYLRYYNLERPHMGLKMKKPIDIINQ